jgi:hypothetical protein
MNPQLKQQPQAAGSVSTRRLLNDEDPQLQTILLKDLEVQQPPQYCKLWESRQLAAVSAAIQKQFGHQPAAAAAAAAGAEVAAVTVAVNTPLPQLHVMDADAASHLQDVDVTKLIKFQNPNQSNVLSGEGIVCHSTNSALHRLSLVSGHPLSGVEFTSSSQWLNASELLSRTIATHQRLLLAAESHDPSTELSVASPRLSLVQYDECQCGSEAPGSDGSMEGFLDVFGKELAQLRSSQPDLPHDQELLAFTTAAVAAPAPVVASNNALPTSSLCMQ